MWAQRRPRFDSNDDLVDALIERDTVKTTTIEESFRCVDRAIFIPEEQVVSAYEDAPLYDSSTHIHLSAPHIYAVAAEAMRLSPGLSFLNLGSGSGYFSEIVSRVLGPKGISHGVEIEAEVVEWAKSRQARLSDADRTFCRSQFVKGNVFKIDIERSMRYDRIYVGAQAPRSYLQKFAKLLKVGGILVGPFDGAFLVAERPTQTQDISTRMIASVSFAPLKNDAPADSTFVICENLWSREQHHRFPARFKNAVAYCLMSRHCNAPVSKIPDDCWMDVFSFLSSRWFDSKMSEIERLQRLLASETRAREAAESRATRMEMERDRAMALCVMLRRRYAMDLRRHRGAASEEDSSRSDSNDEEEEGE